MGLSICKPINIKEPTRKFHGSEHTEISKEIHLLYKEGSWFIAQRNINKK